MRLPPLLLAVAALATGCASSPKPNFQAIYPGMHTRQVVEAMRSGPSRAQEFGDGSSAWYYGEDQCVLIRDEKVVSKQQTQESTTPVGTFQGSIDTDAIKEKVKKTGDDVLGQPTE